MRKQLLGLAMLMLLMSCSANMYIPAMTFPCQWPGTPGFSGNIDQQKIPDPSGICYYPPRKTLFVVSDEGILYEIKTDGEPVFSQKIPGDLEGVAFNPDSGLLYIVIEGEDTILEFDPDKREATRKFPINRAFRGNSEFLQKQRDKYDNGIESIVFIPNKKSPEGGTFYAGNQDDPPGIFELLVPLRSSQEAVTEAHIIRMLPFKIYDPSDMYYDSETGILNVISDTDNILVEMTLEGKEIKEYALPGDRQEGITRDEEGYLYIAQDSGGILKLKDLRKR